MLEEQLSVKCRPELLTKILLSLHKQMITTCIFAFFQPLVNSYSYTDPERLVSPGLDKGTWKERSWLESTQVP